MSKKITKKDLIQNIKKLYPYYNNLESLKKESLNEILNVKCNNIPIKNDILKKHKQKDNAWISIDESVYSIRKDDLKLLEIFKHLYGKNVKEFILNDIMFTNVKQRILLLEKLKERKIGYLV